MARIDYAIKLANTFATRSRDGLLSFSQDNFVALVAAIERQVQHDFGGLDVAQAMAAIKGSPFGRFQQIEELSTKALDFRLSHKQIDWIDFATRVQAIARLSAQAYKTPMNGEKVARHASAIMLSLDVIDHKLHGPSPETEKIHEHAARIVAIATGAEQKQASGLGGRTTNVSSEPTVT